MELFDYMKKHPFSESNGYNNTGINKAAFFQHLHLLLYSREMSLVWSQTDSIHVLLVHYFNISFNITLHTYIILIIDSNF
jgi:hypothetical protein